MDDGQGRFVEGIDEGVNAGPDIGTTLVSLLPQRAAVTASEASIVEVVDGGFGVVQDPAS